MKHLPFIIGRKEWEKNGSKSVGSLTTMLWETVEHLFLYISDLNRENKDLKERIEALEKKSNINN